MKFTTLAATLAASSCTIALAAPAAAQQQRYNIPPGSLKTALDAYGRQSGRPIIYKAEEVRGKQSRGYRGAGTADQALASILAGTGLTTRAGDGGAIAIVAAGNGQSAGTAPEGDALDYGTKPEILVIGKRSWTLNTGITRTEDDSQPWQVFDREAIERSGSRDLDSFFRDALGANNGASTPEQQGNTNARTSINLRGLGADETLILVDGRRLPGVNLGTGSLEQPSISGIPIGSIERIEVLPSSASGIYGGNATGGVINIILRRDYRGLELSASYGDVFKGNAADRRIDIAGGLNLEGGRTNLNFSGSWNKVDALQAGDRNFVQRGRALLQTTAPQLLLDAVGSTPNIRSTTGAVLTLDPIYGGASLGSSFTSVPEGYRGIGLDGVAPLVANAGVRNLDLAPTAAGAYQSLTSAREILSGRVSARREFAPWLTLYGEVSASRTQSSFLTPGASSAVTLGANAPNNPFQQAIRVLVPHVGADKALDLEFKTFGALGGAIVKLPHEWQAVADYSWSRSTSSYSLPPPLDLATATGLSLGTLDVVRDLRLDPIAYGFLASPSLGVEPSRSATETVSLRLAGPLPLSLPGGKPSLTLLLEQTRNTVDDSVQVLSQPTFGQISYVPARSQRTRSAYGELLLPIVAPGNAIPFLRSLELRGAARYDQTIGVGALAAVSCSLVFGTLPPPPYDCPPAGTVIPTSRSKRSTINPSLSLRWEPTKDIIFRASYATGYLPLSLAQLMKQAGSFTVNVVDPERGNERIGTPVNATTGIIGGLSGGNPDLDPERSTSWTAGVIVQPSFAPGLRLSADWTRIDKKDIYFNPATLLSRGTTPEGQAQFEDFLTRNPERFTRGPASGGFAVGPITAIDASLVNFAGARIEAWDFKADYRHGFGAAGNLNLSASATYLHSLRVQVSESAPITEYAGVLTNQFQFNGASEGGLRWKANASAIWSTDIWSLGVRTHFYDSYFLQTSHAVVPAQGSAKVPSQIYFDLFGSYRVLKNTELKFGIKNIFNKAPPIDIGNSLYYSVLGDPRMANYYISLSQKF